MVSTFFYCLKQGIRNIFRNIWFSLASVATISACIFLFCLFFSIVSNIQYMVRRMESTVGVTVLFHEELEEEQIREVGEQILTWGGIRDMVYISEEEAWASFQNIYFAGHEELAEGFAEDNPLAGSSSYVIYLEDISRQEEFAAWLEGLEGVRQVNYANTVVSGLSNFNKILSLISLVIIGVLLAVAMFLINNTISVAAAFRKRESEIMRLIGATNFMIRAPFIVEGLLLGLAGAVVPLGIIFVLYTRSVAYIAERFHMLADVFTFIPIAEIYPVMIAVAMALGVGIGFVGSFVTIRKYLRV
ncbi:MAG: ABC transporter permease [Lachnospiraceae bacterium]|nr:ABC transporter permease [Lachnospiraceae bacterium]